MTIERKLFTTHFDPEKYFKVKYAVKSKTSLKDAALAIALGQSIGNPSVRSIWETDDMVEKHACKIMGDYDTFEEQAAKSGVIEILFPLVNTNFKEDGVSHILNQIMGGQTDIDIIQKCYALDISFLDFVRTEYFNSSRHGISGIRNFTKVHGKPLLGGIVKPKTGISPEILLEMVKEMVEGGVNFIKEDEILSNPHFCTIEDRVPLIMEYLKDKNVIYAVSITSDPLYVLERAELVNRLGGNAIHVNVWSGLGIYKSIRDLKLPLFLFYQKSGERTITDPSNRFGVSWKILCKLAGFSGVDFIHAGMLGGYMGMEESELREIIDILHRYNVLPSLSCGMHPGLVSMITKKFGVDYMANVGGAIHGHTGGTYAGACAMRQAIDGEVTGAEYQEAIKLWGEHHDF